MKKSTIALALAFAMAAGACAQDVTASDEYQALEADLAKVQARLDEATDGIAAADSDASNLRRERALAIMNKNKQLLDDPESFGTEEEVADLLGSHATEAAMMDDDVFGSVSFRQGFYNTLFGGTTDAQITTYDMWVSNDGTQGGVLWVWSGTNFAGNPFELPGISLIEFAEDGRISYELVTYPYPDDYVREAFLGEGTPTPSTD